MLKVSTERKSQAGLLATIGKAISDLRGRIFPSGQILPPSRAVRRKWANVLEEMGHHEVRRLLYSASIADLHRGDRFVNADAGILLGRHRFPTRAFVERWLGDGDDGASNAEWRTLIWVMLGLQAIVGLMYWMAVGF